MLEKILSLILAPIIAFTSFFSLPSRVSYIEEVLPDATFGAFSPAGGLTYRLQSSIGTTNTTLTLSSFKNRSDIPLTMTVLNTDIAYGTLSPQTSRSEFISFTSRILSLITSRIFSRSRSL